MTTSTLPDGSQVNTQTFDGDGRVDTQTDGEGNVTTFQYEQPPNERGHNGPRSPRPSQPATSTPTVQNLVGCNR